MNSDNTLWDSTTLRHSGIKPDSGFSDALETRRNIYSMITSAEQAVLMPEQYGAWSHALRAALACRIARQNNAQNLAAGYKEMIKTTEYAGVEDPDNDGSSLGLAGVLSFVDRVATQPHAVVGADIGQIKQAGVADADIVRLCELIAFVSFQIRVVTGLSVASEVAS